MKIQPGKIVQLQILESPNGDVLCGKGEFTITLPRGEAHDKKPGDPVEVFIYYDEHRELAATTRLPQIQLNETGLFRVKNCGEFGAFIDIGTRRDILIPQREQQEPLNAGRMCLVVLKCDEMNKRLFASTRLVAHIKNNGHRYKRGDQVELTIAEKIEPGRRVIINGRHLGLLFRNEIIGPLRLGQKVKGYIREVRGNDLTVSTQKEGMELLEEATQRLLEYLQNNNGYVRLTDDTDPEEIKMRLRMSKKTFKKAAGILYKEGKVVLKKFGIALAPSETNQYVPEERKRPQKKTHSTSPKLRETQNPKPDSTDR